MVKNITFITSYFAPAWAYGGPPRVLYILAKELIKRGKSVSVITTDALNTRRSPILREKMDGIEIYRFKTISNTLAYKLKIFIAPQVLKNVKKILDRSDVVLFSDVRAVINWQLYRYVWKRAIPYGIFPFGEIPYGNNLKTIIKRISDVWWVKDFIEKASFRFAQTRHEQEMFKQFYDIPLSETQLLSLPVEKREYRPGINLLNAFKKKWSIEKNDRVFLFVGRLHYLKGVDVLIKAVKPLLKKDRYLKLMVVGRDDGEEDNLRRIIPSALNKQVFFTGPLYGKDVMYAYNTATCFVFTPRYYEETSLAALEALSWGVPVITTSQADIPHLKEYKAGLVIKNEPSVIGKSIIEMLREVKKNQKEIKKQAKKLINDYFFSEKITRRLLAFIEGRKV